MAEEERMQTIYRRNRPVQNQFEYWLWSSHCVSNTWQLEKY